MSGLWQDPWSGGNAYKPTGQTILKSNETTAIPQYIDETTKPLWISWGPWLPGPFNGYALTSVDGGTNNAFIVQHPGIWFGFLNVSAASGITSLTREIYLTIATFAPDLVNYDIYGTPYPGVGQKMSIPGQNNDGSMTLLFPASEGAVIALGLTCSEAGVTMNPTTKAFNNSSGVERTIEYPGAMAFGGQLTP